MTIHCYPIVAVILLFLGTVPCNVKANLQQPLKKDTSKKCAICHYRWVPTFFIEHRSTPIAQPEEKALEISSREMCISCHDGSVRDSRSKICDEPGHRVGSIPSKNVSIPAEYPLNENGALKCTTCHTPHAVTTGSDSMVQYFLRAPNENSSFCRQCHKMNLGGKAKGNHPLDVPTNTKVDIVKQAGGKFGMVSPNQIICETCHLAHGGVNNKRLVLPIENTKTMSILCEVCHTKTASKPGEVSSDTVSHPVDIIPRQDMQIPFSWSNGNKIFLGSRGEVVCRTCHKPHQAVDREFLLADHKGKDDLCVQCHRSHTSFARTGHDLRISAPHEKNSRGKAATDSGLCSPCHVVHGGTATYLWARDISGEHPESDEYCSTCHASRQCAGKKLPRDYTHPLQVNVTDSAVTFPLFDEKGNKRVNGLVSCMTCHDVHNPEPLYSAGDSEQVKHGKFLRMGDQGPSAHCMQCHSGHGLVAGTVHDLRNEDTSFQNMLGQSPLQSGLCSACHAAHNAPQKEFLWAAPRGKSVPYGWSDVQGAQGNMSVSFCTGCHMKGCVAEKRIPQFGLHPHQFYGCALGYENDFSTDGILLYTDSGVRSDNGTIVCTTCHNVHQRGQELTGLQSGMAVKFLRQDLPERFCKACHGEEALFRFLYFHKRTAR